MNMLEKGAVLASEVGKGLYDAGAGLLEFINDVHAATSAIGYLRRATSAAWKTNNTVTDDWLSTFSDNFNNSNHQAFVKALGFDPGSISKETLAEAYEIASFVKNDPATQAALFNFAKEFAKTQHEQEWAYIGGGALFEIALAALLAAATGGLGAAGAAARRALYIDKFAELGQLLKTLTRQLKQKAQYKVKRGQTNGAVEHQITRPDGAEVPTVIKPLALDEEWFDNETFRQSPHSGLHNHDDLRPDVQKDSFKTDRKIDFTNLSQSDKAAVKALREQGWDNEMISQVLSSGNDSFKLNEIKAGDKLYGFTSKGWDKPIDSAYWADKASFLDVKTKYFKNGKWDKEGVKNYLALPCYNKADSIDIAKVTQDTTVVESQIGKATELLQYIGDNGYTTGLKPKNMSGGGNQVTVDPKYIQSVRNQTDAKH